MHQKQPGHASPLLLSSKSLKWEGGHIVGTDIMKIWLITVQTADNPSPCNILLSNTATLTHVNFITSCSLYSEVRHLTDQLTTNRWASVAQTEEKAHAASDRKMSEFTVHHTLLCMGLHSHRPVSHRHQWAREHQRCTTEQWKKVITRFF